MKRWMIAGFVAAAMGQTAWVGKMITDRAAILRYGKEVVLDTGFVDPRDLFRGRSVALRLEISSIPKAMAMFPEVPERGYPVYVSLKEGEDGFWQVSAMSLDPLRDGAPFMKGTYRWAGTDSYFVDFPIDLYSGPKLRAQELENIRQDRNLGVIVALTENGAAAIKGITIAGERYYEEPLY